MSMKTVKATLAAMTLLGGTAAITAPAMAQYGPAAAPAATPPPAAQTPTAPTEPAVPPRPYNLTRAERTAFTPVVTAVTAADWPTATTALAAAAEVARSEDARYLVGQIRLQIGLGTNNQQMQSQAIDEMIASGGARPNEMRALYENQLAFATTAGDTAKAARASAALDALSPNDPARLIRQAGIKATANDHAGAIALYQQAMQMQQTAGQPVSNDLRLQIARSAYRARMPETVRYMREWLVAAPSPSSWHDTLSILAEFSGSDAGVKLDIFRLMRAAGAMTVEGDYIALATAAKDAILYKEESDVLAEGLARNLIGGNAAYARDRVARFTRGAAEERTSLPGERTAALAGRDPVAALRLADTYYGYRDFPVAIELYRAALQKGGDANVINLKLGAALALAGQRAEAETAFRAVTGPRAELAQLWLLWLSMPR
jgi:hypothetical protein